jgi:hypothetical protein
LTFPVTVAPKPAVKKRKKEAKLSPKVEAGSKLVATNIQLLERFPSRRNYTYGRDKSNDLKKRDLPRTNNSCRVLFKHLKKHGLGFVLDLELDEIQMEYLLVVSWKAFCGIDFSQKFYPDEGLRNVIPIFPFPYTPNKKRMERYYKRHLHKKETLQSTKRGEVVRLTLEDINDHTQQEEIFDSDDEEESEEEDEDEKPRKRQKLGKDRYVVHQTSTQSQSVTATLSFPRLRSGKVVQKHGRIKPYTKGIGSTSAVLCDVKPYIMFIELALCLHAYLHYRPPRRARLFALARGGLLS